MPNVALLGSQVRPNPFSAYWRFIPSPPRRFLHGGSFGLQVRAIPSLAYRWCSSRSTKEKPGEIYSAAADTNES